jgi:hypothetical protein
MAAVRRDPLTIGAALAAVSAVVTTIAVNLPLNDALGDGRTRETDEQPWVLWHHFRTGAAIVAFHPLLHPDNKLMPSPSTSFRCRSGADGSLCSNPCMIRTLPGQSTSRQPWSS